MLYPEHIEQKIDFVSIRQLLKQKSISTLGKERVDEIRFSADFENVQKLLCQTDEMLRIISFGKEEIPIGDFFDLREAFVRVRVEGLYLDELEIFNLRRALEAVRRLVVFIQKQEVAEFPHLHELISEVEIFPEIIQKIDKILDKFGKIKDNASSELARVRKEIVAVQSSVSKTLHAILRQAQAAGYVEKDTAPSMREGRLVIPVPPAYKRKIGGIVHDESATGKTVYIEPQQVVEANNRVRELENEERREIMRILLDFTEFVRPYTEQIFASQYFLAEIDFLRAKALFANEIKAIKPRVENLCQLNWTKAVHPLLYLSLRKQGKEVVPLNICLNEKQRILLISGPNAGGKSVCLKTTVLLQYMLQCGLLVPLHDSSSCGIFEQIFIDIGDEQSIENDLSTYSSHLLNMKFFVRNCNAKTLFLIDEFGAGTEPTIGGAIAESLLENFNARQSFGVITTHYTNLKHFAEETEGIVNGAMLYDRQHLQPLFQLAVGRPGSSFAVEIARKIGLPEDLIQKASEKVGAEHLNFDKHLQDIVRDKRYWENKRKEIRTKEKRLQETVEKYENELSEINKQRKEILLKARDEAKNLLSDTNAKIENTIRQIKEAEAEKERTRTARKELETFKEQIFQEKPPKSPTGGTFKKVQKKQSTKNISTTQPLKIGDNARLKGQTAIGIILELQERQAVVAFGQLKSTVHLNKLEKIGSNQLKRENRGKYELLGKTTSDEVRKRKLNFKSEIDVRGMRADEALQAITYFIDDAIMVGISGVRILHGTGTGALRQAIRQYLNTIPNIKNSRDEHVQMGGAGITVVEFE